MDFYNIDNHDYRQIVKHSVLTPLIKIELLDHAENTYAELIDELNFDNAGAISDTLKQGVRKTINFTIFDPAGKFIPDPNDKYFWIGRKFKVYLGVSKTRFFSAEMPWIYSYNEQDIVAFLKANNPNNWDDTNLEIPDNDNDGHILFEKNTVEEEEDRYWFSKGVFIITDITGSRRGADKTITINGVDKFGMFGNETGFSEMIGTFTIEEGMSIYGAITSILNQDMGNGELLDPIQPIIDPYYRNESVKVDISKGPGSYVGDILIDLANAYRADIFYDNDGRLNFWRAMIGEESAAIPKIWDFYDSDPEYISSSIGYDLVKIANVVSVVGDNPNAKVAPTAIVENRNLASPLAVQKIGRKCRSFETSLIKTYSEAFDYANYQLKMLTLIQHTINFESTFLPNLEVNKLFTLTDMFYNIIQEQFIIRSLTIPLGIGNTRISGSSIKELPTYSGG